jgi:hypothetical protein
VKAQSTFGRLHSLILRMPATVLIQPNASLDPFADALARDVAGTARPSIADPPAADVPRYAATALPALSHGPHVGRLGRARRVRFSA